MKYLIAVILTLLTTPGWSADIIPDNRKARWSTSTVGLAGGIPTGWTNWCDVTVSIPGTNIVAIPDTTNDCSVPIMTALKLCPSNSVVYLPAGRYLLKTNIQWGANTSIKATAHNTILRGAGTNLTFLQADYTNSGHSTITLGSFSFNGFLRTNFTDLLVGQTNLYWTNMSGVTPGAMIWLIENDASTNVFDPGPSDGSADPVHYQQPNGTKSKVTTSNTALIRQGFIVQSVSGSNFTVWPPSNFNFHSNWSFGRLSQTYSARYCGIESLTVSNLPGALGVNIANNISISQSAYCWISNVLSVNASFAHVRPEYSIGTTMTKSRVSGSPSTGPSSGVGIHFAGHVTNPLIYDNVFHSTFPAIEFYLGTSGAAILYNAAVDSRGGLPAFDYHNAHHELNLIEGNVANGVIQDGYFGSARWITLHRNWFHASPADGGFRRAVDLCSYAREWNIVNNVLGNPTNTPAVYDGTFTNGWSGGLSAIYRLGQPNMGNTTFTGTNSDRFATNVAALDLWVRTNLIRHLNYDFVTAGVTNHDSAITNTTSPVSYFEEYNTTNPPVWYTNAAWPPIGSELTSKTNGNPAYNWYYGITYSGGGGGGGGSPPTLPEYDEEFMRILQWFFFPIVTHPLFR